MEPINEENDSIFRDNGQISQNGTAIEIVGDESENTTDATVNNSTFDYPDEEGSNNEFSQEDDDEEYETENEDENENENVSENNIPRETVTINMADIGSAFLPPYIPILNQDQLNNLSEAITSNRRTINLPNDIETGLSSQYVMKSSKKVLIPEYFSNFDKYRIQPINVIISKKENSISQQLKRKIGKPYGNIIVFRHDIKIDQWDNQGWLTTGDFNAEMELTEDDIMTRSVIVQSMMDNVLSILKTENINSEELDNKFKSYLQNVPNGINYVISVMLENSTWTFDPMKKFIWIYLMMACYYEPRAIKYIIENESFSKELVHKSDSFGVSPILIACKSTSPDTFIELNKYGLITNSALNVKHRSGVTPMIALFSNWNVFEYAIKLIPNFETICDKPFEGFNKIMPIHIACAESEQVAKYMIENSLVTNKSFNAIYEGYTVCMLSAIFNPLLFPVILESDLCTEEILKIEHHIYGNIVMITALHNRPLLSYMLVTQKLTKSMINQKLQNTTNILFELADSHTSFVELIESNLIDQGDEIFTYLNGDNETIFNKLVKENLDSFKYLLNSNKVNSDMLNIGQKSCLITAIETLSIDAINAILDSKLFNQNMLLKCNENNQNAIMMILQLSANSGFDISEVLPKLYKYVNAELITQKANDNLNTLAYIAIRDPKKFNEIIEYDFMKANNYQLLRNALSEKYMNDITMLCAICCMSSDIESLSKILQHYAITADMLSVKFKNGLNILLEVAKYRQDLIVDIITSDKCTSELFNQVDSYGDNLILKFIKNIDEFDEISELIFDKIITSKYITKNHINNVDKEGNTLLILASTRSEKILKKVLDSEYFNIELFSKKSRNGDNCFIAACKSNNMAIIKTIGDHKSFTKKMYTIKSVISALESSDEIRDYVLNHNFNNEKTLLKSVKEWIYEYNMKPNIIRSILSCKYMTKDVLLTKNKHGINMLAYAMVDDFELAKSIITSDFCTYELFSMLDEKGRNILNFFGGFEGLAELIVDSPHFKTELLLTINKNGNSPLEKMLMDNLIDEASYIMKSDKCNIDVLKLASNNTNIICSMSTYGIEDIILSLPYVTADDLLITDNNGKTALHNAIAIVDDDGTYASVNKILSSEKCSSKLLEAVDKNNDTFLMLNYEILEGVLKCNHCTKDLLYKTNNRGMSILTILCANAPSMIPLILNDERVGQDILLMTGPNIIDPISLSMTLYNTALDELLNSEKCSDQVINSINGLGTTALLLGVFKNNYVNVEKLLNSKYDLSVSFDHKDKDGRTLLMYATAYDANIFKLLFTSKYTNMERMIRGDVYNHNVMIHALSNSLEITKLIVESQYWVTDLQKYRDIDDDFLLLYPYRKPEIVEYLMASGKCTTEMILMTNKVGMNCSHYYAKNSSESLQYLLDSELCTPEVLMQQDYLGNTPLHYACKLNQESAVIILKSKHFNQLNLMIQNRMKQNPFMIALEYNKPIAKMMYDMGLITKEIVVQADKEDNTVAHYAIRFSETIARKIIKSDYFKDIIGLRNLENYTLIMMASKYNGKLVKDIIATKLCTNDMMFSMHSDYGSCLTIAAQYQPVAIKHILDWEDLDRKIIYSYDDHKDFVQIACQMNAESVKYIVESERNLSEFIEGKNIIIAAKYQPRALEYILKSKYGSPKLFDIYVDEQNCVDVSFHRQPMSLVKILESEHSTHEIMNREDRTTGYRLIHKLNRIYDSVNSLDDITKLELTKYKNEYCDDTSSKFICQVCYEYEKLVVFQCGHSCCVGCGFNIDKCHICRKRIEVRNCIYD